MQGFYNQARHVKQFESRAAWGPNSIEGEGREGRIAIQTLLHEFANAEQSGMAAMLCAAA